jgi:glycosyltransferase involved in cell wall biosynthesis
MPEVAGDAAILVDPRSLSDIVEAMRGVLDNTSLKDQLRQSGYRRIQQFSWDRTAEATAATYKKALGLLSS